MSNQFDWEFDDEDPPLGEEGSSEPASALRFWIGAIIILVVLGGAWGFSHQKNGRAQNEKQQIVQTVVDQLAQACQDGDGEQFFLLQLNEPAWQAAILAPHNRQAICAGPSVTRVQDHGEELWANLTWKEHNESWQQLAFFRRLPGGVIQIPPPEDYAGVRRDRDTRWGTLVFSDNDDALASAVVSHVDSWIENHCRDSNCLKERRPFTLELRSDFRQTAEPNVIYLPSPRLVALDESGQPAAPFRAALDTALAEQLTPGTIRFAVPSPLLQVIDFESVAQEFMGQNPHLSIEIVALEMPPEEPTADLAQYDGAAYTPSAAMVAAGLVLDLTNYMESDAAFDTADFYEQVWQGAWWRDRMWYFPHAGQMRLLFIDEDAYRKAGLPAPSLHWTWDEMKADLEALLMAGPYDPTAAWQGEWGLLDTTRDTLFAYAFTHQSSCAGVVPSRCQRPLGIADVAASMFWYQEMTAGPNRMPATAGLSPLESESMKANWQSVPRTAVMWVDDPVRFEHHMQYYRVDARPFPGTDRLDGVTPIWVHGSFISTQSERPRDVWRWLDFLSYQNLNAPLRYVPARPSVARRTNYWDILPGPLRGTMHTAFPFTRPVTLGERELITRSRLEAVVQDKQAVFEVAGRPVSLNWFGDQTSE